MTALPKLIAEKDAEIARLTAELKAWKPDFAHQGHACPGCGRKYGNAEKDQLEQRIEELEAVISGGIPSEMIAALKGVAVEDKP